MGRQANDAALTESVFKERGYNEDIMPKTSAQRNNSAFNFFTLWMGAVHNIPNYTAVGGFLLLGLSPLQVIFALILSSFVIALLRSEERRVGKECIFCMWVFLFDIK